MGLRLKVTYPAHGYITLDGSNDYGEVGYQVGRFTGAFVLDVRFRASTAAANKAIIAKLNPTSGGGGSARGWLFGTHADAKTKFYYCMSDGDITEYLGTTILQNDTDYRAQLISDGSTLTIRLSDDDGETWTTQNTITAANCFTMLADDNSYPTSIGRGRWGGGWVDYWSGRIGRICIIKGSDNPVDPATIDYCMYATGSNPAIIDRMGNYNGASYNGVTGTQVATDEYAESGEYISDPLDAISVPAPRVGWTATVPEDTSITVYYGINETTEAVPETWTEVENGEALTMPEELSSKFLWLRVVLATTDSFVTPEMTALWLDEAAGNPNVIQVKLTYAGRMRHPQGDIMINFTGQLDGGLGSMVEPFSDSFTPDDLVLFFNPHDPEALELIGVSPIITRYHVTYSNNPYYTENAIEAVGVVATVVRTAVADLPE